MSASGARRAQHWAELPLEPGRRALVEASAGTGKTWTIGVLYLRLLLECDLGPRQIVVTTFTEAAAQELRERLRARLAWARRAAQAQLAGTDQAAASDDAQWLHARWSAPEAVSADLLRLRLALAEFDLAPIGTLHGLCRRILADYPFECGSAFEPGELAAEQALRSELLDDLWRGLSQSPQAEPGDLVWLAEGRAKLCTALVPLLAPDLELRAPEPGEVAELLGPEAAARVRAFAGDGTWFKRANSAYRGALCRLADFVERGEAEAGFALEPELVEPDLAKHIRPERLAAAREHETVRWAGMAARRLYEYPLAQRAQALSRYRERIRAWRQARLAARGQITFEAMIERVHAAVHVPGGVLAERLFAAWPAALVDEFQDTDARQYAILDRVYRDAGGDPRGTLVMIGDPKQAIYRFRGGDLHAYLRAAKTADTHLGLGTNFRSARAYVAAFNAFYTLVEPGFGHPGEDAAIEYLPVQASDRCDAQPYTIGQGPCATPLMLHYLADCPDGAPARREDALRACADQIATMLQSGEHRIGGHRLAPGDLAVLLPKNEQVAALRRLLAERAVPCVGAARSSVFAGDWAEDLLIALHAVWHCEDAAAVRAALATRLFGYDYARLLGLEADLDDWQRQLARFHRLREHWRRRGVLAVVLELLRLAAPQCLAGPGGERDLTDLRHLGELLQAQSLLRPGEERLLAWLRAQRSEAATDEAAEDRQLRIESDAARVRLLTLHGSKGLEFPIVLLPLMWDHGGREAAIPVTEDPASGARIADLGSPDWERARAQAAAEDQRERMRVLYVALTRARYACHVYALPPARRRDGRITTPAADPERSPLDALLERLLRKREAGLDLAATVPQIGWSEAGWPWRFTRYRPPAPAAVAAAGALAEPEARPYRGVYSFSALVDARRAPWVEEAPASDEGAGDEDAAGEETPERLGELPAALVQAASSAALQALAAVRGPEFGNAVHAIFERRRIGQPLAEQLDLVVRALREEQAPLGALSAEGLARLLAPRLDAALAADLGGGLRLGEVPAGAQRAELEFHFALDEVPVARLREVCRAHGRSDLVPPDLADPTLRGLLTGKIDLVFEHGGRYHLLDYKSNHLGECVEDYLPAALETAMDRHHYRFQALLYSVALHRLLRRRLPDYAQSTRRGEVVYLFVRAAGLAPGAGVWRQRFGDELIAAVDAAFAGDMQEAPA